MFKLLNRRKQILEISGFATRSLDGSTSIYALGGLGGSIRNILRIDHYIWKYLLSPVLYAERFLFSLCGGSAIR